MMKARLIKILLVDDDAPIRRMLERTPSAGVYVATYDVAVTLTDLRLAVQASAAKEAFDRSIREMRSVRSLTTRSKAASSPVRAGSGIDQCSPP